MKIKSTEIDKTFADPFSLWGARIIITAETIDWAKTLLLLHTETLEPQLVKDTLNVILKFQEDIENVDSEISSITAKINKP